MFLDERLKGANEFRLAEYIALCEAGAPLWLPDYDNVPQYRAYFSSAQVIGFGGAAGGGKTDLMLGKALNQHSDSMIMRRVGTELDPVIKRLLALHRSNDGYTGGHPAVLKFKRKNSPLAEAVERTIALAAIPNLGDETKFQGNPNDFKAYDEATNFLLQQIRFLSTWLRNTRVPTQHRQQLMTFNPPQTAEGRWVLEYFAAWLDKQHKNPAAHGELRYFIPIGVGGTVTDREVQPGREYIVRDNQPVPSSEFTESDYVRFADELRMPVNVWKRQNVMAPQSRTFIGSRVTDNKYQDAAYLAQLQSLPEPLRSQMLNGDFYAGISDSEWQVIPTEWVKAAMARWQPRDRKPTMDSVGVDVARGGQDNSIIARRHDNWYDIPLVFPGKSTPDGPALAAQVVAARRDAAPIHIDVVGVGSSPYDFLNHASFQIIGVNGGSKQGIESFKSQGGLAYTNWKSYLWWAMREDLDPTNNLGIALPPDKQLEKDLTAPVWKHVGGRIQVESREDIIKRIGRSPDWGSAYVLARLSTPKLQDLEQRESVAIGHDPLGIFDPSLSNGAGSGHPGGGHNPFA